MGRYVVLLSSGLDSTYNLWRCHNEGGVALALTFDYGQRAARQEIKHAICQCELLGINHKVVGLPWFSDFTRSALLNREVSVPQGEEVNIESLTRSQETAHAVWVPNRNGILLNIAAAYAEQVGALAIVPGFNREEATTFPDNTVDFMHALAHSLSYSTANQVNVECFSGDMDKAQIMEDALARHVRLDLVWACYFADEEPCGICESCQRFLRAARLNPGAKAKLGHGYGQYLEG